MKIKTTSGHLTATNKAHIKEILNRSMNHAKVNRINYKIERLSEPNEYKVLVSQIDRTILIGEPISISKATFKILN